MDQTIDIEQRGAVGQLAAEHAVTKLLAEPRPFHEIVPELLQTVGHLGDWQLGALWLVDEPSRLLRCFDFWSAAGVDVAEFESSTRQATFARGVGLPGRVWASGDPTWIADVATDQNFPRAFLASAAGVHGAIAFPIRVRKRTAGVIEFFSRDVRPVDGGLLQVLESVGAQIGRFIELRDIDEVRDRLAAIVDSSDDAIVSKTLEGVITSWNRGAQDIFGYTAEEAVGRHVTLIIPKDRHSEEDEVLARLRRGEKIDHYETIRQRKDGRLVNISLTVSPVRNAEGRIVGASKVARDITEQKQAEESLRRSEEQARAQVQARDEFLSLVAHELRNPLNALQLQMVGLRRAAVDSPDPALPRGWVCDRLQQATDDAGALVRLVHNLLDVARIDAGRVLVEPEPLDFSDAVRVVLRRFGQQLADCQVVLDAKPLAGRADRLRFEQIVTNLVSNAIKYGEGKPIEIAVRAADGDHVRVDVMDRGIGISPIDQERLFERFSRAAPRRRYGGFGLGLWIVRETVHAMGGEIAIRSRPGEGSTFSVVLPRQDVR